MARKPRPKRWVFWGFTAGFALFGFLPLLAVLWAWVLPVPATPLMALRLLEGEGWSHRWVPLDRVAPSLVPSIIAAEDNTFCQHDGIDWPGLARAVREVQQGRREQARGASTISMQVTKNLLLWPGRDEIRKALELTYLPWIEGLWSKRRILEVYINIVELGPGIYGVEAAARHHFGVPASDLTPRQSALLAAVLPNPREWNAGQPGSYVSQRAETLQRRARDIAPLLTCF